MCIRDSAETVHTTWRERLEQVIERWKGLRYVFEISRQVLYFGVPILLLAWSDATYSLSDLEVGEYLAEMAPIVAKTHDDLGKNFVRQGLYGRAIEEHQKSVALDPEFAQAYTHLGIAHSLSGDRVQAIEHHLKAIELDPQMAQAYYNLGVDYWGMGKVGEAERVFKQSIELDNQYINAYKALSQVYKKKVKKISKFKDIVFYSSVKICLGPIIFILWWLIVPIITYNLSGENLEFGAFIEFCSLVEAPLIISLYVRQILLFCRK